MSDESSPNLEQTKLRQRALEELRARPPREGVETDRLVHELQVHQIELEMQNEQLREVHRELEASLERYTELYDFAPMALLTLGREGNIRGTNFAGGRLLGTERGRLTGANFCFFVAERERADFHAFLARVFSGPGKHGYEVTLCPTEGEARIVTIEAALACNPEECGCVIIDITERRHLEQHLLRAQRLESIGTLAGGIAHDLNNALTPVLVAADLLKGRITDPAGREMLELIQGNTVHAADLLRQILSFARGVEGQRVDVPVRGIIRDLERLANETFLKSIVVHVCIVPDLWRLMGDPTQLRQLLLNLCVNARDAMPAGGTLIITAMNRLLDARDANLDPEAHAGPYVLLEVEDNGTGIPPAILERIFEPFFTTKEIGEGTGLGLATVRGIVKGHGGFLQVATKPGRGTKFSVYLPAQCEKAAPAAPASEQELPRGHGELILVVDDEPTLRAVARMMLTAFGYTAEVVATGAEAVEVYERRKAEIAVVLTDLMMPVMGGVAVIEALRKIDRAVPIIATSGVATSDQAAKAIGVGANYFLGKPYQQATLLALLHDALS